MITTEINRTINVMCLNHPETIPAPPRPWKKCLSRKQSLVPKRLGSSGIESVSPTVGDDSNLYADPSARVGRALD